MSMLVLQECYLMPGTDTSTETVTLTADIVNYLLMPNLDATTKLNGVLVFWLDCDH